MDCKTYTFLLSSGQLETKSPLKKAWIKKHLLVCSACRRFTRNNEQLSRYVRMKRKAIKGE